MLALGTSQAGRAALAALMETGAHQPGDIIQRGDIIEEAI